MMKSIEQHPFIRQQVFSNARLLILGSFPCLNNNGDYGNWFYSGSGKNYFWEILGTIKNEDLLTRQAKQQFCSKYQIAITDLFCTIHRKNNTCSDQNLVVHQTNETEIIQILETNHIQQIFFTSRLVENYFYQLIKKNTRLAQLCQGCQCEAIISPSPSANRAIGAIPAYKKRKATGYTTLDYRIDVYKKALFDN